jgi:flagellar L-ring protein precursor FlgH
LAFPVISNGQSLWTDKSGSYYVKPNKRFYVGDLLTIIISEQSSATSRTGVSGDEGSSVLVGPGAGMLTSLLPYIKGSMETSYDGASGTNKTGTLKAQLTVEIVSIDENGNLIFEGSKEIKVNEDIQRLTFSGIVRPEDVRSDNTVYSTFVADAKIEYLGNDYGTKKGFLGRFLDWLF